MRSRRSRRWRRRSGASSPRSEHRRRRRRGSYRPRLGDPPGQPGRATVPVDAAVDADGRCPLAPGHAQEVGDLKGGARHGAHRQRDLDLLVEVQGPPVPDEHLEDGEFPASVPRARLPVARRRIATGPNRFVRVADRTQVLDPGLLEVRQVRRVVHDTHGVGLGEPGPQPVDEAVVRRVARRLEGLAGHGPPITPPWERFRRGPTRSWWWRRRPAGATRPSGSRGPC